LLLITSLRNNSGIESNEGQQSTLSYFNKYGHSGCANWFG